MLELKVVLFLQVVIVVGLPLILWGPLRLGRLFPLAIIQIFAGIMLGPSIFGAISPQAFAFFFREEVRAGVETLANVALVLFVFIAGCEADRRVLQSSAGTVVRTGVTGVTLAWALGSLAALGLLAMAPGGQLVGSLGNTGLYAISFGLCMAVTALPVLSILLRELGYNTRRIGTLALAIGGVDDALLWLSLAVLLPFAAGAKSFWISAGTAAAGGILTFIVLHKVVARGLDEMIRREVQERLLISLAIVVLFLAAAVNEALGLHAAIGAFLCGLLLPEEIRHKCLERLDTPVTLLLLPFLFLATGLKTTFDLGDGTVWLIVGVALLVAVGAKFVGVAGMTYLSGQSLPFSITLGVLMQCKGLMEIVIVTILYQKGVIGLTTFSALVLVAFISTAITAPLARLCEHIFGPAALQAKDEPALAPVPMPEPAPTPLPAPPPVPHAAAYALAFDGPIGVVPLTKSEIIIGRHSGSDIRIDDVRVSRQHARLQLVDGTYELHNLTAVRSEPNPILVNGVAREHAVLRDGDQIAIGGVRCTFRRA